MVACDGFVAGIVLCIISLPKQSAPEWKNVLLTRQLWKIYIGVIFKEIFALVRAEHEDS